MNKSHLIYTFNIQNGIIADALKEFKTTHALLYLSGETGIVRLENKLLI